MSTLSVWPGRGRLGFFPFAAEDDSFALVPDVDKDEITFDADDAALHNLVDADLFATPVDVFRRDALEGRVEFVFPFCFAEVETSNQVAIDHNRILKSWS